MIGHKNLFDQKKEIQMNIQPYGLYWLQSQNKNKIKWMKNQVEL